MLELLISFLSQLLSSISSIIFSFFHQIRILHIFFSCIMSCLLDSVTVSSCGLSFTQIICCCCPCAEGHLWTESGSFSTRCWGFMCENSLAPPSPQILPLGLHHLFFFYSPTPFLFLFVCHSPSLFLPSATILSPACIATLSFHRNLSMNL